MLEWRGFDESPLWLDERTGQIWSFRRVFNEPKPFLPVISLQTSGAFTMELQVIQNKIYEIRGMRVMLDFDLATLYQVENRVLKQGVRRNIRRFPEDFMFQLTKTEWKELITNSDNLPANARFSPATPYAFTEQGVAMLSSVMHSDRAIEVNIAIMRAFVVLRQNISDYKGLKAKIEFLEKEMNLQFEDINQALNYLLEKDQDEQKAKKRKRIGFKTGKKKK